MFKKIIAIMALLACLACCCSFTFADNASAAPVAACTQCGCSR